MARRKIGDRMCRSPIRLVLGRPSRLNWLRRRGSCVSGGTCRGCCGFGRNRWVRDGRRVSRRRSRRCRLGTEPDDGVGGEFDGESETLNSVRLRRCFRAWLLERSLASPNDRCRVVSEWVVYETEPCPRNGSGAGGWVGTRFGTLRRSCDLIRAFPIGRSLPRGHEASFYESIQRAGRGDDYPRLVGHRHDDRGARLGQCRQRDTRGGLARPPVPRRGGQLPALSARDFQIAAPETDLTGRRRRQMPRASRRYEICNGNAYERGATI